MPNRIIGLIYELNHINSQIKDKSEIFRYLFSFLRHYAQLPNWDNIWRDPLHAPQPSSDKIICLIILLCSINLIIQRIWNQYILLSCILSYLDEDIQWKHLCCMRELRVRGIFKPLLEVHVASTPRSDGQSSHFTCYLTQMSKKQHLKCSRVGYLRY